MRQGPTDAVQPVQSHSLKRPPHHGILLQHLIEVIHRQGVEAAVVVGPHAGRPSASGQQADLCTDGNTWRHVSVTAVNKHAHLAMTHFPYVGIHS